MATVPLSGTVIRFLSGVPFSNDYKHTRYFATRDEQVNYFSNKDRVHSMEQSSFQRQGDRPYTDVDASIDKLYGTNYMYFQNPDFSTRRFYAFVTELEYKNAGTTRVYFEIDVYQTWYLDTVFKPSFVVREHRPLWQDDGRPVVNTIDEGLDYGLEYDTVSIEQFVPNDGILFMVVVCKTPMHEGDDGNSITPSIIGMPQPLTFYIVPYDPKNNATVISTGDGDSFPITSPETILKDLYTNEKAVNNIVSVYITNSIGKKVTAVRTIGSPTVVRNLIDSNIIDVGVGATSTCLYVKKMSTFTTDISSLSENKYDDFVPVTESKLLMFPYTNIVLDDFTGNRMSYKVEYINGKQFGLLVKGSLGLSNFVTYGVDNYKHGNIMDDPNFMPLNNETALINNKPNDVSVVNDYLTAFLQGNKNQINTQENAIIFNSAMNGINGALTAGASQAMGNPLGVASGVTDIVSGAGNGVLQLQAIESKQKDISNTPPTISKMGSNTSYNMGHGLTGVYIIKKQIKAEYRRKLSDFFNAYGYKTNEFKVPNMNTRRYWNYVQTKDCIIRGNMNNTDLKLLKAVFDNGITLWHTDDVGNYELENEVVG